MKTLELFCGTKSFSKVMEKHGHKTFTIDIESRFSPDLCIDILKLKRDMLPRENFDIVWASPPCTTFSVASIRHYWKNGKPKNKKTLEGIKIVKKTIAMIKLLKPKYFFIENPRGMLRKQDFMKQFPRQTITYCKYGLHYQKATDIWTNCKEWKPRLPCSNGDPCHVRSPRGSKTGVQGLIPARRSAMHPDWAYCIDRKGGSAVMRAIIPESLFEEILESIK